MPVPPAIGNPSGMDTERTIQDLLRLERVPIQRMEQDIMRFEVRIQGWEELRNRTRELAELSRDLYSFAGPFATKTVESSDPGAISGQASSSVESVRQRIEILNLATSHQIHSGTVLNTEEIPPGSFKLGVGEELQEFSFRGGNLQSLESLIRRNARGYDVSRIRVDADQSLLALESSVLGREGAFQFEDPDGLLDRIGLVEMTATTDENVTRNLDFREDVLNPVVRQGNGSEGNMLVSNNSLLLERRLAVQYMGEIPDRFDIQLEINLENPTPQGDGENAQPDSAEPQSEEPEATNSGDDSERMEIGPEITVDVGDVRLHAYNMERERSVSERTPDNENTADHSSEAADQQGEPARAGIAVLYTESGEQKRREITWSRSATVSAPLREILGDVSIDALYFFSEGDGSVTFDNAQIVYPEQDGTALAAKHVTQDAEDARLRINGIEITRSQNNDLTDIIEGVSLSLHRVTEQPVTLTIQSNTDEILDKIQQWVAAYNEVRGFARENSFTADEQDMSMQRRMQEEEGMASNYRNVQDNSGVFAADSTVRQLLAAMDNVTTQPYPSSTRPSFRILADIGISTGSPGSNWGNIADGKLQINEERLREVLSQNPESVKELFASDTSENTRIDNGVAFRLHQTLDAYNGERGMIASRIDRLKDQITDNTDRIERKEASLEAQEESLRQRFGRMESAIMRNRARGQQLQNRLGQ